MTKIWLLMVALTPTDHGLTSAGIYEVHYTQAECEIQKYQMLALTIESSMHWFCTDKEGLLKLRSGDPF